MPKLRQGLGVVYRTMRKGPILDLAPKKVEERLPALLDIKDEQLIGWHMFFDVLVVSCVLTLGLGTPSMCQLAPW